MDRIWFHTEDCEKKTEFHYETDETVQIDSNLYLFESFDFNLYFFE